MRGNDWTQDGRRPDPTRVAGMDGERQLRVHEHEDAPAALRFAYPWFGLSAMYGVPLVMCGSVCDGTFQIHCRFSYRGVPRKLLRYLFSRLQEPDGSETGLPMGNGRSAASEAGDGTENGPE